MNFDAPSTLKAQLDIDVIGQDAAKNALANAFFLYELRLHQLYRGMNVEHKSHILLTGPSGSGKTYLPRVLSEITDMPLIHIDASSLTSPGWSGTNIHDAIVGEMQRLDLTESNMAILVIDEIDKISLGASSTRADHNRSIQSSLLGMLEGKSGSADIYQGIGRKKITYHPDLFFIICSGAFTDLERSSSNKGDLRQSLISTGMIPELINRFVDVVELSELTGNDLFSILLKGPHSALNFYKEVFERCGAELVLTDIEEQEIKSKLKLGNARDINNILFKVLSPRMQNLKPSTLLLEHQQTLERNLENNDD